MDNSLMNSIERFRAKAQADADAVKAKGGIHRNHVLRELIRDRVMNDGDPMNIVGEVMKVLKEQAEESPSYADYNDRFYHNLGQAFFATLEQREL